MESVENTASFDKFKKYLHVLRPVEVDLRTLLNRVNSANKKTLILLCGSAGDGKSHLISYLRNADSEHLLDTFELYNDVIKDKAIVSTREILNLLYDILVHPDFDYNTMCKAATSETKYLTKYIQCTTPMLLYEFDDISPLINAIRKHDLLKDRQADMDVDMTRFHSLENIYEAFMAATANTPYAKLNDTTKIAVLGGIKAELKKLVYRFIVRTKDIKGEYPVNEQQQLFDEYLQYLYYQNSGNEKKLGKLYDATKKAIMNWDGQFDSDTICIDDSNEKFWVLEQLLIKPAIYKAQASITGEVLRFSTTLKLRYRKANDTEIETAEISMDYALFEMVSAMKEGYRPTVQDKNQHADFVSFVQRIIEFGNKASRIVLVPKENEHDYKVIFEQTDFGYEFKVVQA